MPSRKPERASAPAEPERQGQLAENRKAHFHYQIERRLRAGLAPRGPQNTKPPAVAAAIKRRVGRGWSGGSVSPAGCSRGIRARLAASTPTVSANWLW